MKGSLKKIGARGKVFRDPIHGLIKIDQEDKFILELINTPEFQRLRRIRQLGVSSMTYPGAEHSRFAHSLGVFSFSTRMLDMLRHRYRGNKTLVDLLDTKKKTVKAAALLHDVGHAPFSHMMERVFSATANHEKRTSELIVDQSSRIYKVLKSNDINPDEVRDIINKASEYRLLVDIVSSQLDADRMDYILRDALATGVKYGAFDAEWLLNSLCIGSEPKSSSRFKKTEWRLCLEAKRGLHSAEQLIIARRHMSLQVYFHKVTRGWEAHLRCLFKHAAELAKNNELPAGTPEIAAKFLSKQGELTIAEFLLFDEATLIAAMQQWALANQPNHQTLSELSRGYLERRKMYACSDLSQTSMQKLLELHEELEKLGKADLHWVLDYVDFNSYKDFHSGLHNAKRAGEDADEMTSTEAILLADGTLGCPSSPVEGQSTILGSLGKESRQPVCRLYYVFSLSRAVKKVLDKLKIKTN